MISRKLMLGAAALWLAAISPAALAAAPAAAAPAAAAPAPVKITPNKESFDKYRVLITNNIFTRVHHDIRDHGPAGPPLGPEEATALRGVVRQGEGANAVYFVFLEDVRTQETTKMRVGDPVCFGKLVNPTLDSVEYLKNGVAKRIEIGQDLTGKQAAEPVPPAAAQPTLVTGTGGAPGAADNTGNSATLQPLNRGIGASPASPGPSLPPEVVAEQMRQKRLKELGK